MVQISIVNGKPDGRLVRGRPIYSMSGVSREIDVVAGSELYRLALALHLEPCTTAQDEDPLAVILVIPGIGWRGLAEGDDSLHAPVAQSRQNVESLGAAARGQSSKDVSAAQPISVHSPLEFLDPACIRRDASGSLTHRQRIRHEMPTVADCGLRTIPSGRQTPTRASSRDECRRVCGS